MERQPFTYEIQTLHILEMTSFSISADWPFLKDRIPKLGNLTVSSMKTAITTQSHWEGDRGGGRIRCLRISSRKKWLEKHTRPSEDFL